MTTTTSITDGGPAFPLPVGMSASAVNVRGMTLRDYFAAKAMQALLVPGDYSCSSYNPEAKAAYLVADAMLKARK